MGVKVSTCISRLICAFLAAGLLFAPTLAMAEGGELPGDVFTAIMLKTLNYDRNIDRQSKDKVVIGIVYLADNAGAQGFAGLVKDNIEKVRSTFLLKDKPVEGRVLALEKTFDKAMFAEQLKQDNISVLVLAINDPAVVNSILEMTRSMRISSVCSDWACARSGVGLGIVLKDNKPRMLVNLSATRQEGSDYSGKFLALCEVIN
jgi:uncharacterized protein with ATP-grasp and redox domains